MGNGRYYMGQMNVTKTGIPCQKWDSQKPHTHIQPPKVFPQVQNAENYCRNAGGEEPSPWCYTMNESVRWQLCDIPLCRTYHKIRFDAFEIHFLIIGLIDLVWILNLV